jgi:hypothetical protein
MLSLSHDVKLIFFSFFASITQVNKTLTNVNLKWNNLGPEGGKAIAKSLGVRSSFSLSSLSL